MNLRCFLSGRDKLKPSCICLFTWFILQSENGGYYKGSLYGSYNPFFSNFSLKHSNDSDIAVVGNLAKCDPARADTCLNSVTLVISGTTVSTGFE